MAGRPAPAHHGPGHRPARRHVLPNLRNRSALGHAPVPHYGQIPHEATDINCVGMDECHACQRQKEAAASRAPSAVGHPNALQRDQCRSDGCTENRKPRQSSDVESSPGSPRNSVSDNANPAVPIGDVHDRDPSAEVSLPASRYSRITGTGRAGRTLAVMWFTVSDATLYLPTQRQHLDRMRNGQ
jgi:hypothetical protein